MYGTWSTPVIVVYHLIFNFNETHNDFIYSRDFKGALQITPKIMIDIYSLLVPIVTIPNKHTGQQIRLGLAGVISS